MGNAKARISETILRVSTLLLKLMEKPLNYEDIFKLLEEKVSTQIYTTEAINKYLNTLRAIGLIITREKGKYYLHNFLTQITLTKEEIQAFNQLETFILKYGTLKNIATFKNFKTKLMKYLDGNSKKEINCLKEVLLNSKLGMAIKTFQEICDEEQRIKIEYNNNTYTVEPKKICYENNKVYLECYDCETITIKKLILEKINLLSRQPVKNKNIILSNTIVFSLSGKLAKTYKLKDGETVISDNTDELYIKTTNQDYEFLARRLIRYKNFCKIIKPDDFREYFLNYTDKILELYK